MDESESSVSAPPEKESNSADNNEATGEYENLSHKERLDHKLMRKPLSPITKSYKEIVYQCKQCDAQFSKKLDMHIHRLAHGDGEGKTDTSCDQTKIKTERDLPSQEAKPQSELLPDDVSNDNAGNDADDQVMERLFRSAQEEQDMPTPTPGPGPSEEDYPDHDMELSQLTDEERDKALFLQRLQEFQADVDVEKLVNASSKEYQDILSKMLSSTNQNKYYLDVIVSTPRRTYQCAPCDKRFDDYSEYLQHREDHPNPKAFKCNICSKGFTMKGNLTRHKQIHKDVRQFKCTVCGKKFSQKTHLMTHLGTHTRRPFFCKMCGMSFQTERELTKHSAYEHVKVSGVELAIESAANTESAHQEAPKLTEESKSMESAEKNDNQAIVATSNSPVISGDSQMVVVYPKQNDEDAIPDHYYRNIHYTCGTCHVVFFDFQTYINHKKEHPTPKLFSCDQCGKSFTVKGNLQRHSQIHQDVRLHECNVCFKKFSQKTHLSAHMHVHSKARPYVCNVCGGSFTREGNLRRHIKMHTAVKKDVSLQVEKIQETFTCDVCFKPFMRKGNLKRHQKLHRAIQTSAES